MPNLSQAATLRGHAIMHFCSAFTRAINPTAPSTQALAGALSDWEVAALADVLDRAAERLLDMVPSSTAAGHEIDVARIWVEKAKTIRLLMNSPDWRA